MVFVKVVFFLECTVLLQKERSLFFFSRKSVLLKVELKCIDGLKRLYRVKNISYSFAQFLGGKKEIITCGLLLQLGNLRFSIQMS